MAKVLHLHGLVLVGIGEVEGRGALTAVGTSTEAEGAIGSLRLCHAVVGILVLVGEVLLDDVVGLHVDLLVGIGLALVDLLHAAALLNEKSVAVDGVRRITGGLLVQVTDLEDVLEAVQSDLDDLVVWAAEKVTQGLDAALSYEIADLIGLLKTSTSSVADSPASLLARLKVTVGQQVNQRRDDVSVNDGLDLGRVAGGDVGNGPARLLPDTVLVGAQERQQAGQGTAVDDDLGLNVVTGDDVSNRAQGRSLHRRGGVHEQLDQTAGDTGFNNGLNLVVGPVGQVGDGPAGIDQDLVVQRVDQLGKHGERRGDLWQFVSCGFGLQWMPGRHVQTHCVPVWLGGLATAEVAQGPGGVAQHAELAAVTKQSQQRLQGAAAQDVVAALWAVTGNVSEGPHSLLADIGLWAGEELDKDGDGAGLDNNLGLCSTTGGDVGEGPGGLELDESVGGSEELDETADDTSLDDLLNRGIALLGQEFSEPGGSLDLQIDLVREDTLHHLREVLAQLLRVSILASPGEWCSD